MEIKYTCTGSMIKNCRLVTIYFLFSVIISSSFCQSNTASGQLKKITFYSTALGIEKSFNIYLPESYDEGDKRYPVVYLFRGHENEWRDQGNIRNIVNNLVSEGEIGEMIIVLPGITFEGSFLGFPINMLNPGPHEEFPGLGSGQFEDYMINDLIPYVDKNFRTIAERIYRATDGFSAGAYSSIYIALKFPELFCSVGSYDGNLGYLDFDNPHIPGELDDPIYMNLPLFDPYFGNPRNLEYMKQCNPANMIHKASSELIEQIKEIQFFILAASENATSAYKEGTYFLRVKHFIEILSEKGIKNYWGMDALEMSQTADHNWNSAMDYIKKSLPLHWKEFNKRH